MKDERKPITPAELKKNRRLATAFGIMAIVMIISLVYAFVEQLKSTKIVELAEHQRAIAIAAKEEAEQLALEVKRQAAIAEETMRLLQECRASRK